MSRRGWPVPARAAVALLAAGLALGVRAQPRPQDLDELSLEDLGKVIVTSVAKSPQRLSQAPASIYVITHDDIIRSGASSVPEMLRLAPNIEVFQTAPSTYVVTARGGAGYPSAENLSNKLLVLIDGRSVYNPLFSGVYWEMQQVLPENVERIEVISGPGGALWGANAVNGVINIITRPAAETQGGLLAAGLGTDHSHLTLQYGGELGPNASYRVYGTSLHDDTFEAPDGSIKHDEWTKHQAGFRVDWTPGARDQVSFEGGAFHGRQNQGDKPDQTISGSHILTRWQRNLGTDSSLQLLAYFDRVHKMAEPNLGGFTIKTIDLQLQHSFTAGDWNYIVWGIGERRNEYDITNAVGDVFAIKPADFTLNVANVFAQDQMKFGRHFNLTLGLKLEDDPYSDLSVMPNLRASWRFDHGGMLWGAVSRAVRAPTPLDTHVLQKVGSLDFIVGNPRFAPEKLTAFDLGYRQQVSARGSFSVTLFDHRYDDLKTIERAPDGVFPLSFHNRMKGDVYGIEAWGSYQPLDWWRLSAGLYLQRRDLEFKPGATEVKPLGQAGDDPSHQGFLRSTMQLSEHWTLFADLREVGPLPDPRVPGYWELNTRLGWNVNKRLEISLSGHNLLHAWHQEYGGEQSDLIGRSVLLETRLRF
ncbi:MAG TPA: TonB-dependent receptor [Gammaproteobacteria bacterium]|nr:TonB-dependent receptor [Gammaproteobacteria bacterium]